MPLSVVGAGFGRTGTLSLKVALEQLGFGPCHHMVEVVDRPQACTPWIDAADGAPVDWEEMFEGYRSAVDWPSCTFYRRLAEAYPEAKVILTVRNSASWFASTQATIFGRHFPDKPTNDFEAMLHKVIARLFDGRMRDREKLISVYDAHNAEVRQAIPPERLLVYDVAQGWEPLCAFLRAPIPDGPMPKVNSTEEFHRRMAERVPP